MVELLADPAVHWFHILRAHFHVFCPHRKELRSPEGFLCSSIEELKNVWLPFSIRMKMTKNKGLDVCNWADEHEVQAVEKWEEERD